VQRSVHLKRTSPFLTPEDKERERQSKRDAVLQTAASLFCVQGYNATQMGDVAEQLGVTKPTIYYYFKNKEDVLVACFEVGFELIESTLRNEGNRARNGAERLRNVLYAYAEIMTQDFGKCTIRIPTTDISKQSRERIDQHRRNFDSRIRSLVKAAIEDGSMPPCDPKIATFTILGSLNWIGQWHKESGDLQPGILPGQLLGSYFRVSKAGERRRFADWAYAVCRGR
jgi:AcrR family transcriptional regulator